MKKGSCQNLLEIGKLHIVISVDLNSSNKWIHLHFYIIMSGTWWFASQYYDGGNNRKKKCVLFNKAVHIMTVVTYTLSKGGHGTFNPV